MELDVHRLRPQINAVSTQDIVDKYKASFEVTDYQVKVQLNFYWYMIRIKPQKLVKN